MIFCVIISVACNVLRDCLLRVLLLKRKPTPIGTHVYCMSVFLFYVKLTIVLGKIKRRALVKHRLFLRLQALFNQTGYLSRNNCLFDRVIYTDPNYYRYHPKR